MLIIAIILFGMLVGAAAQLILRRGGSGINWPLAFGTGIAGSFVGGMLGSLIAGDGLNIRMSGIIGSIIGAIIALLIWRAVQSRSGGRRRVV